MLPLGRLESGVIFREKGKVAQNETLVRCYELLGIAPDSGLEACHRAYLKQLDIWNSNAIDEDANPSLFEEVRLRRQAIDEAHRLIVEQAEQAEHAADGAAAAGDGAGPDPAAVPPLDGSAGTGSAGTGSAGNGNRSADDDGVSANSVSLAAPGPAAPELGREMPGREMPGREMPGRATSLQPGGQASARPMPDTELLGDSANANAPGPRSGSSRVAPSYGGTTLPEPAAVMQLIRWDKPAGRVILMIPALWAAFLATNGGPIPWGIILVLVLGSLATSAAGCAANDLWDQKFDAQVERTRDRPLASGRLSRRNAIAVLVICALISIFLAFQLNWTSLQLCAAAGIVILFYPTAKRMFPVPQLVLAIAWGFAVLIGWSAVTGSLAFPTFLLWLATVFWTLGFDTVYAMADQEDDRRIGLQSSALFFAERSPDAVGLFFIGTAAMMLWLGLNLGLGWPFWLALILSILGWFKQHSNLDHSRMRPTTRIYSDIFAQNVWFGLLLLAGIILGLPGN